MFFSLLPLLLSIICAATQVTWPEAAAQRNNPTLCSAPSPRCHLCSSCPFPSASHPGASFDPGAGLLCKKGEKSSSGLAEGSWVHRDTHKKLMLLFCHAETISGSPRLKLLTARKDGGDGKTLGHFTVLGCPACHLLPGWLPGSWQVRIPRIL